MKVKHFFYLLLALPLMFVACDDPDVQPAPELKLNSEATVSFEADGGNGEISYEIKNAINGVNLTATTDAPEWITNITVGEKVNYTVEKNESEEARSGKITLKYEACEAVITVNQAGAVITPEPDVVEYVMAGAMRIQDNEIPANVVALVMADDSENVELYLGLIGAEGDTVLKAGTYTMEDGTVDEECAIIIYEPEGGYEFTEATVEVAVEGEVYNFDMNFVDSEGVKVHVTYEGVVYGMEPAPDPEPETIKPVKVVAECYEAGNFWVSIYVSEDLFHDLDMYDTINPNENYLSTGHYSKEDGSIDWATWGYIDENDGYYVSSELTAAEIDLTINDDNTVTLKGYLESQEGHHGDIDWTGVVEGFTFETEKELSIWTLVGTHNGWNPAAGIEMYVVDGYNVAYGVELTTDSEFKFVKNGAWGGDLGGDVATQPNCRYATGSSNIKVTEAGTYDIYLNGDTDTYYIMSEGKLPSEAGDPTPVEPDVEWNVIGDFQSGNWSAPVTMTKDGDYYVAQDVVFANANNEGLAFKVRKFNNWDNDSTFGTADGATYELGSEIALVSSTNGGKNIVVEGEVGVAYDVYVDVNNLKVWVMQDGLKPGAGEPSSYTFTSANVTTVANGYLAITFSDGSNNLVVEFNNKTDVIEAGEWKSDSTYLEGTISSAFTKLNGDKVKDGGVCVIYRDGSKYNINMSFETANGPFTANFDGNIFFEDGTKMGAPKLEVIEVASVDVGFRAADGSEMEIIFYQNDMNKNAHIIDFLPTTPNVKYLEAGTYSMAAGTISQEYSFYRYISTTDKAALTSAEFTFTHHDDGTTTIVGEFLTVNEQPCSIEWTGKVGGFDFSTGGDTNFTEWAENTNIKSLGTTNGASEYMFCGFSADGSLEINLDCYSYPSNSDKIWPEGTYNVDSWKMKADFEAAGVYKYCLNDSYGYHNGVKYTLTSGTVDIKHVSGQYEITFDVVTSTGENLKGKYLGGVGEYGSAKLPN